jgi:hypothetical protein
MKDTRRHRPRHAAARVIRSLGWRARALIVTFGIVVVGAGGLAMTGGLASAQTAPGAVTAVTHSSGHSDTTSATGPACTSSPNGSVWAYDNLSERFIVTPESAPNTYSVTINTTGSFAGFANPNDCSALTGNGSVRGTIQYDVSSSTAPDKANLPAQQPPDTGLGTALNELFGGNATIIGGGHYSFTYTLVDGQVYTQTG